MAIGYVHEGLKLPIDPAQCLDQEVNCPHPLARIFLQSSRLVFSEVNERDMWVLQEQLVSTRNVSERTGIIFKDNPEYLETLSQFLEVDIDVISDWNYAFTYLQLVNALKREIPFGVEINGNFDDDLYRFADYYGIRLQSLESVETHLESVRSQLSAERLVNLVASMHRVSDNLLESSLVYDILVQRLSIYSLFQMGQLDRLEEYYELYDNSYALRTRRNILWAREIEHNRRVSLGEPGLITYMGGIFHFLGRESLINTLESRHNFEARHLSLEDADHLLRYLEENDKLRSRRRFNPGGETSYFRTLVPMGTIGNKINSAYCFEDVFANR